MCSHSFLKRVTKSILVAQIITASSFFAKKVFQKEVLLNMYQFIQTVSNVLFKPLSRDSVEN